MRGEPGRRRLVSLATLAPMPELSQKGVLVGVLGICLSLATGSPGPICIPRRALGSLVPLAEPDPRERREKAWIWPMGLRWVPLAEPTMPRELGPPGLTESARGLVTVTSRRPGAVMVSLATLWLPCRLG